MVPFSYGFNSFKGKFISLCLYLFYYIAIGNIFLLEKHIVTIFFALPVVWLVFPYKTMSPEIVESLRNAPMKNLLYVCVKSNWDRTQCSKSDQRSTSSLRPIMSMMDVNPFLRDPRLTMASRLPHLTFLRLPKMPIY